MQSIAATQLATQQNALALAVSEACQCRLSPGHPVLVLAKSTLQCLGFALELKRIGKFILKNSRRQILFEAQVQKFLVWYRVFVRASDSIAIIAHNSTQSYSDVSCCVNTTGASEI